MRKTVYLFLIGSLCFFACKSENNSTKSVAETPPKEVSKPEKTSKKEAKFDANKCPLKGSFKLENIKAFPQNDQFMVILADDSTKDKNLGESHRVLLVKDQNSCKDVFRQILPINRSPDFPYYIADINYNNTNALVAIKGYDKVFCYDIENQKLLPELKPQFANAREANDAQSGQIKHLELWEDYIIGYAMDFGSFVFAIRDNEKIEPVKPSVEFSPQGVENYTSLFALPSADGKIQLLLPQYNSSQKQFLLNPILEEPLKVDPSKNLISKDKRFAIIWDSNKNQAVVIDLLKQKQLRLDKSMTSKSPVEIMKTLVK